MNIDLEKSLADLAGSVHDDGAGERMSGQVRSMVGRIRRRRAARQTANGVVGVAAAGAVVLGGVQLAGREAQTPPATTSSPVASDCGTTPAALDSGAVSGLSITFGTVDREPGQPLTSMPVRVDYAVEEEISELEGNPVVVVTQDGVVVSERATFDSVLESMPPIYVFDQPLTSCEPSSLGDPLPPGDYTVVATHTVVTAAGDRIQLIGEAPLKVEELTAPVESTTPAPDEQAEPTPDPQTEPGTAASAQARVDAMLTSPTGSFPQCGASTATMDDGLHPITLDMALPAAGFTGGETFESQVALSPGELTEYVIGNASPTASLLILKDGVVVGKQWLDAEDTTLVDLAAGEVQTFPLLASMTVCGTGEGGTGEALPLPPGDYKAMAVLEVLLKEIQETGGEAQSTNVLFPAISGAVDITVG